jgi:Leucine-rich repeat (LRR) protein
MQGFEVLGANHRLTSAGFDSSNKNETYSFLRHLLSIRSLWLRSSRVIERLDELPILSLLERLDLMAFQSLKDVNPPASLKELKYLSLRGCVKLADLSPLSNYTKLEKLELRNCPQVVSIESLTECPNLSHITVEHCAKLSRIPDSLKPKLTMR